MSSVDRFFRRYLTGYLGWYAVGTAALVATNWMSVEIPMILGRAIDALTHGGDATAEAGSIALLGLGVIVVRTASRLLFFTPGRLVEARLKRDLFERMIRQQPRFLRQWSVGDLVSRHTSDVNMARLLAGFTALGIVNTAVALVVTGAQMIRISPVLAAMTVIPVLVGFAITQAVVRRLLFWMTALQQQAAALSDHVLTSYQGIGTVRVHRAHAAFEQRFQDLSADWVRSSIRRSDLRVGIGPVLSLAAALDVFLLLWFGGAMAIRGELTVGELVGFTSLAAYLVGPLRGMSFIVSLWKQSEASIDRLEEVLRPEPERPDLVRPGGPLPAPTQPPRIELRNLGFTWPGTGRAALHGVSATLPPGRTLGVFGPTGAGKSTLLQLLARLENPAPGTVLVDGVDLLDLDLDGWRRATCVVQQRPFLFSETVRDNLLLGAPDDGRLDRILATVSLGPDLASFPAGLDTPIGEAGVTLSGGQRQRVALARGLVRPHVVRLLDDVLSAVDAETEASLLPQLMCGDATTVLVSHRISALRNAHEILVLGDEGVVDRGTHADLVTRPGPYQDAWHAESQLRAAS
ncbi:MAG: ABC transporter ATP-binding protein [Deltaproteobacteria bacterium]|nr:ABC transporter ATP-binding protein [Deltaproteobacteria bacterium]